ncbi:hypothetical protein S245_064687, partial [Arachis hypogaea]
LLPKSKKEVETGKLASPPPPQELPPSVALRHYHRRLVVRASSSFKNRSFFFLELGASVPDSSNSNRLLSCVRRLASVSVTILPPLLRLLRRKTHLHSSFLPSSSESRSSTKKKTLDFDDSAEKPTYVRFLVSNSAAGSVIGKGGSTITDFQSQSGARIQAVELILSKLLSELQSEDENDPEPKTKVRLIVPNGSCGGIIGKGGATI